jgi:hypothetical protein
MSVVDIGRRISLTCSRQTMLDTVKTLVYVVGRIIWEPDETRLANVYFVLFVTAQRPDDSTNLVVCSRAVFVTTFQAHLLAPGCWLLLRGIHDSA